MFTIIVTFIDDTTKTFQGNFILEGSFVRINFDHDKDKKTPQKTAIYPAHLVKSIDCDVIQSGVNK